MLGFFIQELCKIITKIVNYYARNSIFIRFIQNINKLNYENLKKLSIVAIMALVFTSCKNETQPEVKTVDVEVTKRDVAKTLDPNATYAKVEFGIDGMTCAMGCAKTIEKKMAKMEGVKTAKVDFDKRLAMVEYDEAKVTPKSLEETVAKVADMYKVKDMKIVEHLVMKRKSM